MHLRLVGDVAVTRYRPVVVLDDCLGGARNGLLVDVDAIDRRALRCEPPRRRARDRAAGGGDKRDLSGELCHGFLR